MEKQVIVALILLVAGLLGVGYLIQPASTFSTEYEEDFQKFQWKYDKVYNDLEEVQKRFQIFRENSIKIEAFNKAGHSYKLAMNQFGDLTDEEFTAKYTNEKIVKNKKQNPKKHIQTNRPTKLSWIGILVWSGVYDQGSCGSCWAHSAVEALEGAYAKEHGNFVQLSIQELVDCVYPDEDTCESGGLMDDAFTWIIDKKHGICSKDDYPRKYSEQQFECQKDKCKPILNDIIEFFDVPEADYVQSLNYLSVAPLSVAIDASVFAFRYYSSGIITGNESEGLNHAVLMVGYDENEKSITVKNSWGSDWGDKGYFKVGLQKGIGPLGIFLMQSYPKYKDEPVPEY